MKAKKWLQRRSGTVRLSTALGRCTVLPKYPRPTSAVLSEESGLCLQAEDGFQELESHPRDREPSHPSPQQLGSVQIDRGFLLAQLSKDYGLDAISEP
ncbi:hypothetical protein CapIbe_012005 [Capra ibex]